MCAYVWRSGFIGFGPTCPEDALPIASAKDGQEEQLRSLIQAHATRHLRLGRIRVPGVTLGVPDEEAFEAFVKWQAGVMEVWKGEQGAGA